MGAFNRLNSWLLATLCTSLTFAPKLLAQEPGSNVAPPNSGAYSNNATQGSPGGVPESSPGFVADPQEPTIDSTTTRRVYPNVPLLITGGVLFGATYGASVIYAATTEREADRKLYYPVAGPFLDLEHRGCNFNPCNNEDLNKAILIADGVVQGLGALAILASFVIPEKTTRNWLLLGNSSFQLSPARVGYASYGLGAYGRF